MYTFRCHNMGIQCRKVRRNVNYNNVCEAKLPPNKRNDELTKPARNTTETNRFRCEHVGEELRSLRSSQSTPSPMPQPRSMAAPPATKCVQLHLQPSHDVQGDTERSSHSNDAERKLRLKKTVSSSLKITIANKLIKRFTQLISFNQDHKSSASSYTNAVTIAPTNNTNINDNANLDRIESADTNDRNNSTKYKLNSNYNNTVTNTTHSQCFLRQSLSLYAASGFLLALCYLVIPAAATIDIPHPM